MFSLHLIFVLLQMRKQAKNTFFASKRKQFCFCFASFRFKAKMMASFASFSFQFRFVSFSFRFRFLRFASMRNKRKKHFYSHQISLPFRFISLQSEKWRCTLGRRGPVVRPRQNIWTVCFEEGSFNCSTEGGEGKTMIPYTSWYTVCTRMCEDVSVSVCVYLLVFVRIRVCVCGCVLYSKCSCRLWLLTWSSFYTNLGFFLRKYNTARSSYLTLSTPS